MRLALALAALMVAAGSAEAAALSFKSDTTVTGECRHLSLFGHEPISPCDATAELVELMSSRNGVGFRSQNGQAYWFFGPSAGEIHPDEDTIVLAIDGVRVAGDRNGDDQKAVGTCRYGNPFLGSLHIVCHADTMDGPVDAEFVTDGKEPRYR